MTPPDAHVRGRTEKFDGAVWHTSSYSGNDSNCVESAELTGHRRAVRDTKDRARGTLTFAPAGWQTFVDTVRADGPLR